jgi:predicted N-formylglutamate amidohydrolase
MSTPSADALIGPGDPDPVVIDNAQGASPFILIGDHAGRAIPRCLGTLGVGEGDLQRHIAIDIGVRDTGRALATLLDCVFIHQSYSRLVIDCNRHPDWPTAFVTRSDGTAIPGNEALTPAARAARAAAIHAPYHAAIAARIARHRARGMPVILLALHSFTPVMNGFARPWQVGVLHDGGNDRFSNALLASLRAEPGLTVGDNEPYRMAETDYSVPHHCGPAGLPYAEIEVRQDLIADPVGAAHWADFLARAVTRAWHAA